MAIGPSPLVKIDFLKLWFCTSLVSLKKIFNSVDMSITTCDQQHFWLGACLLYLPIYFRVILRFRYFEHAHSRMCDNTRKKH